MATLLVERPCQDDFMLVASKTMPRTPTCGGQKKGESTIFSHTILTTDDDDYDRTERTNRSNQIVFGQVELQYGIFNGGEDETNVRRVGGASEVEVDILLRIRIEVHEHL